MANLDQIKKLNEHYGKKSPITAKTGIFSINESLDPDNIRKAIHDSIGALGPEFARYFDLGLPADIALLFIDICGFSTRYSNLKGEEIGKYFDAYYDIVIPIIYKYGGEIDKIIGDGIICIFGPPFQTIALNDNIIKADECAKEIIKVTKNTKFASKVAFHSGTINYFKNKTGLYKEFTIVGKPLTELFRLEAISIDETINYYDQTDVRKYYAGKSNDIWKHFYRSVNKLEGVSYEKFYSIVYNK